jgi:hypothetical protein
MLLVPDPLDQLTLAQERGEQLRDEAVAERMGTPSGARRTLAEFLRRAADLLDPTPLTWRRSTR